MEFKIDTRNTYTVINPPPAVLDANMAEALAEECRQLAQNGSYSFIINLQECPSAEASCLDALSALHEACYTQNQSLVFTGYNEDLLEVLRHSGADELLNLAPTMQEAIDIVSMEALERELGDWEEEAS